MAYDYMGRRFEYKETVSGTLTRHERYLYRGYLQIAALDMLNSASVKHSIAWDLSEQMATRPLALQVGVNAYFYSFDQVKHVTELFDSAGALASTYDYSPFGQITSFQITQSGNQAITQFSNPLTFSSEVFDFTLGLQYYNYRHLNLLDGRWVNRDPIGDEAFLLRYTIDKSDRERSKMFEQSLLLTYQLVHNSPVVVVDSVGLWGTTDADKKINTIVCSGKGGVSVQLGTGNSPGLQECVLDAIRVHEASHARDALMKNPDICKGKCAGIIVGASNPEEHKASEKKACDVQKSYVNKLVPSESCTQRSIDLIKKHVKEYCEKYK